MKKTYVYQEFINNNPSFIQVANGYTFGLNKNTLFFQDTLSMKIAVLYYSTDDIYENGDPVPKSIIYDNLNDFLHDFN